MLVGAHVSVSGGYPKAVDYALQVGCECLQVFAKSPRQWKGGVIDPDRAEEFTRLRTEHALGPLFTHTAYLINLSTTDEVLREKSIAALTDELQRGRILSASGVVTHLGNDPAEEPRAAAKRAAAAITESFARCGCSHPDTRLLLENTAGAGRTYGSSIEEIGWILEALPDEVRSLTGVCLDTCHAHAYGFDLSSADAWERVIDEFDDRCGAGILGAIHANDCKFERGSNKDRHEWIGDGLLGESSFAAMLCVPRLATVPAITEMPGEVPDKDSVNLDRLKALRQRCEG